MLHLITLKRGFCRPSIKKMKEFFDPSKTIITPNEKEDFEIIKKSILRWLMNKFGYTRNWNSDKGQEALNFIALHVFGSAEKGHENDDDYQIAFMQYLDWSFNQIPD